MVSLRGRCWDRYSEISLADISSGIQCPFSKFVHDAKLRDVVDKPEE